MKIKHLLEGTEPKLPGAPPGVKIMTPQQFVANGEEEKPEDVEEGAEEHNYSDEFVQSQIDYYQKHILSGNTSDRLRINGALNDYRRIKNKRIKDGTWSLEQDVAEAKIHKPKIISKNGQPIGEVGKVPDEGGLGTDVGTYYARLYADDSIMGGYESYQDALEQLNDMIKYYEKRIAQGVTEGSVNDHRPEYKLHKALVYDRGGDRLKQQYEIDKDAKKLIANIRKLAKLRYRTTINVDTAEWIAKDLVYPDRLQGNVDEGIIGKKKPRPDYYTIVNKDGTPASLAAYLDKDSAIKDRDMKYPDAEVRLTGPRGKVKGIMEEIQIWRATVEYGPTAADAHFVSVKANNEDEARAKVEAWCKRKNVQNPMITINGPDRPQHVGEATKLPAQARDQERLARICELSGLNKLQENTK